MKSTFVEIHWTNSPYSSISFRNGIRTGALQNDHRVCLVANSARKKAFENTQMISRKYIDSIYGLKAHIGKMNFLFKKGQPRHLFRLFSVFSNQITIFTTNKCEKCQVHPVYHTRIRTHDLSITSLLP